VAIIGVTGLPGAGKSYICDYMSTKTKCTLLDADKIGHKLLETSKVITFVQDNFPSAIIDGKIIRKTLA